MLADSGDGGNWRILAKTDAGRLTEIPLARKAVESKGYDIPRISGNYYKAPIVLINDLAEIPDSVPSGGDFGGSQGRTIEQVA